MLLLTLLNLESGGAVEATERGLGVNLRPRLSEYGTPWVRKLSPELPYRGILASSATSLTFGGTSTLTGIGNLVGSASLAFGGVGGTVDNITGSAAIVFDATFEPAAGDYDALSGSADLRFGAILAASRVVQISGSANMVLGGSHAVFDPNVFDPNVFDTRELSALTGTGALAASATLQFGGVSFGSTLNPISGVSELVVQYLVTPILGAIKPISGTSALVFGGSLTGTNKGQSGIGNVLRPIEYRFSADWYEILNPIVRRSQLITASSQLNIGASGNLSAGGGLAASSAITFGGTSTLRGIGALAGSSALAFTESAVPNNGAMVGTANLVFDASLGSGLFASEPVTLTASATLQGTGNLQGTSLLLFGSATSLTPTGMFGNASMLFFGSMGPSFRGIGTPIVKRYGNLYPSAPSIVDLSPRNPIQSKLVGSASISIGATATVVGIGYISGSASLTFGGIGVAGGATDATASLVFSSTATPRADGALAGTATLTFGGAGSIVSKVAPSGNAIMTISAFGTINHKGTWIPQDPKVGNWTPQTPVADGWAKQASKSGTWTKKTGT